MALGRRSSTVPQSPLRLVRRSVEYVEQSAIREVPPKARGIYVLYKRRKRRRGTPRFEVVYIGMARGNMRARLQLHRRRKGDLWTHFSLFAVWDNIRDEEISELEGLFRHVYRHDARANPLNLQRGFKPLRKVRDRTLSSWPRDGS